MKVNSNTYKTITLCVPKVSTRTVCVLHSITKRPALNLALLLLFCLLSAHANAQQFANHIRLSAGTGKHYFNYSLSSINEIKKDGLQINGDYDFFFSRKWAISVGVGMQNYFSASETNGTYSFDVENDENLDSYRYNLKCTDLYTEQDGWLVTLPIGLRFESSLRSFRTIYSKYLRYSFSTGIIMAQPLKTKHAHHSGYITSSRYYPDTKTEVYNIPEIGLDTFSAAPYGTLKLRTSYLVYTEVGLMLAAEKNHEFYVSFYFNYGINNSIKSTETQAIDSRGNYTTLLFSDFVQKAHLTSYGIKLGVSIFLQKKKQYL